MDATNMTPIGWVARRKTNREAFGGHRSRCKVYATERLALAAMRGWAFPVSRQEDDAEVRAKWDFLPVYVKEPEG